MAANINRVVLVGNLTRDPELRQTPSGHGRLQPAHRRQHAPQGRCHAAVDREAELLRHHRLRQPGRELRAVPVEGPPGRRSTAASSGASGRRRTARSARPSRSSPTPCSSSAAAATATAAAAAAATSSCRQARRAAPTPTSRAPTTTSRSKESLLAAPKNNPTHRSRAGAEAHRPSRAGPPQVLLLLQVEGRRGRLQERQRASPLRVGEGQDPQPPHQRRVPAPPAPGRGRGQARPRARPAPVRRRQVGPRWKSS